MIHTEDGPDGIADDHTGNPLFGFWPGVVVSDVDPEKRGRVRVRVAHPYGADGEDERIEDGDLPWALPAMQVASGFGEMWVPPIGSAVWVAFFAGSHEDPVYFGGWATSDDAIPEHSGSYTPGPKTRIIKTTNGHLFEMRWVDGEQRIKLLTEAQVELLLSDAASDGPKALMQTPAGYALTLDQLVQVAKLTTPTGNRLELSDSLNQVLLSSLGTLLLTALGAMTISAVALTLTALGLMSITGVGLALLTTGGAVTIGAAGTFQALATAQFVNTTYLTHTHAVTAAPGTTGTPLPVPVAGDLTTNTMAN